MTTPPLPPLPKEFVCTNGLWAYYTADQMQAYATQTRADLEAEVARLREALQNIKHMKTFAIETTSSWCPLATEMVEIASAALENKT